MENKAEAVLLNLEGKAMDKLQQMLFAEAINRHTFSNLFDDQEFLGLEFFIRQLTTAIYGVLACARMGNTEKIKQGDEIITRTIADIENLKESLIEEFNNSKGKMQ